jgi:hypothetical protein
MMAKQMRDQTSRPPPNTADPGRDFATLLFMIAVMVRRKAGRRPPPDPRRP